MPTGTTQFRLKLRPSTAYNFTVDWGDLTSEVYNQVTPSTTANAGITKTYSSAGTYSIKIYENGSGGFPGLYFNNADADATNDSVKVLEVLQWGAVRMNDMSDAFNNCIKLSAVADNSSFSRLSSITNLNRAFRACPLLSAFPPLDMSSVQSLNNTWAYSILTDFPQVSTKNVTDFRNAWFKCSALSAFSFIETDNGTLFSNTWTDCIGLSSFPKINMLSANIVYSTWQNCSSLSAFPIIHMPNATQLYGAWRSCKNLTSFPHISTQNVTDFSYAWFDCTGLNGTNFPTLDMNKMKYTNGIYQGGAGCFGGVTLSTTSYSNLLIDLAAKNTNTNVVFDGGNSKYNTSATSARATLAGRGWSITDGGPV
jgi:hypothetical protein